MHIGGAHIGQIEAAFCLDKRMDVGLGLDEDCDLLGGEVKQIAGLDDLKALVHHRSRVDGDLPPHRPSRVMEGLLRRDKGHFLAAAPPKWATRSRDEDDVEVFSVDAGKQFGDRHMLGVDWIKSPMPLGKRLIDQPPGHDQRLLVGEAKDAVKGKRNQSRLNPGKANQGIDDHVGVDFLQKGY